MKGGQHVAISSKKLEVSMDAVRAIFLESTILINTLFLVL